MGCISGCIRKIFTFLCFFFFLALFPGFPPKTHFEFTEYSVEPARELTGALELNKYLNNAEHWLKGRINGPEHLLVVGKDIYTALNTGEVVRINGDHITHIAKFGQPCEGVYQERKCGRPLGMDYDAKRNQLIVADAYYGIFEVDLSTGQKKLLVPIDTVAEGKVPRKLKLLNAVVAHSNGDLYFTSSSSEFDIQDGIYTIMANPSGRLLHWDRKKNVTTVLVDESYFANGMVMGPNEDFIVFAETISSKVRKYHLTGAKKGSCETLLAGLPGHPDNLSPSAGGFWVPMVVSRDADHPSLMASLPSVPLVRRFLIRLLYLIELPFKTISQIIPNRYTEQMEYILGHFQSAAVTYPARATFLKVDWNGNIIHSIHGDDKSIRISSHVCEFGDHLLIGSPYNQHIGRVKLPKHVKEALKMTADSPSKPTVQTTTPAPPTTTTTTPKPTTTTTTPKPTTTTTTPKPTTTTTTPPPPTTTTPKPATKTTPPNTENGREPAPIHESTKDSPPPPPPEKLKVIKRGGQEGEL